MSVLADAAGASCIRSSIVRATRVSPVPDWFAASIRVTGSHAYTLQGTCVEDDHGSVIDPAAAATVDGPLYRFPFLSLAWVTLAANLAGMARHFVTLADPLIRRRRPMRGAILGDDPAMQRRLSCAGGDLAAVW